MQHSIDALPPRIASKIAIDHSTGCWVWTASRKPEGYGQVRWEGTTRRAHRVVYLILIGPIPKNLFLDHRCFNRACVNPKHLRPVTHKQNNEHRRGPQLSGKSGVRGVTWAKREGRWVAQAKHNGVHYSGGYYATIKEAEQAAIALRASLFTHDDGRIQS